MLNVINNVLNGLISFTTQRYYFILGDNRFKFITDMRRLEFFEIRLKLSSITMNVSDENLTINK
jgi:hypothetical protein